MENASKAAIMAGGVLIAVAIISLALYFYNTMRGYTAQNEEIYTFSQIESFNRFYQSFGNTVKGIDALNLYNKAKDDKLKVTGTFKSDLDPSDYSKSGYKYSISYDGKGRVKSIELNNP